VCVLPYEDSVGWAEDCCRFASQPPRDETDVCPTTRAHALVVYGRNPGHHRHFGHVPSALRAIVDAGECGVEAQVASQQEVSTARCSPKPVGDGANPTPVPDALGMLPYAPENTSPEMSWSACLGTASEQPPLVANIAEWTYAWRRVLPRDLQLQRGARAWFPLRQPAPSAATCG
jgi:hypothetical protein